MAASNSVYSASGPYIEVTPVTGPAGTSVTVSGGHFSLSDKTCALSSNMPSLLSNSNCNISGGQVIGSFVVGNNVPDGSYSVQVTGDQGDFAQWPFTVQSNQITSTTTTLTYTTTSATTQAVQLYSTSTVYTTSMWSSTTTTTQTITSAGLAATSTVQTTSTAVVTSANTQTSIVTRTSEVAIAPNTTTAIITSLATSFLTGGVTTTSTRIIQSTAVTTSGVALSTITSTYQTTVPTYVLSDTTQFWLLGGFLLPVAVIVLLLVRTSARRRPIKCPTCGNENPPYARSYCVKCGAPLSDRRRSV